jgi:DNA-binding NtrC family response regulator
VLEKKGYRILLAENGEDALSVDITHDGTIDLVLTDVVMPKMSGKETVERLQENHPDMKAIFMSGYTENAIVDHGVLAPNLDFIEKPFTPDSLVKIVREVLDRKG